MKNSKLDQSKEKDRFAEHATEIVRRAMRDIDQALELASKPGRIDYGLVNDLKNARGNLRRFLSRSKTVRARIERRIGRLLAEDNVAEMVRQLEPGQGVAVFPAVTMRD